MKVRRHRCPVPAGAALLLALAGASQACAQEFGVTATVDNTTVQTNEPVTLTLTFTGDLRGIALPALEFPNGFAVRTRSQGTSLAIRGGTMERTMTLTYVLVPSRAGEFSLGPFTVEHDAGSASTEPLTITVEPSSLAPSDPPPGGRVTL